MAKRNFDSPIVVATGVQNFEGRFGKRRRSEHDDLPPISQWRCNLTGLSQCHNLYFVAYSRDIYIYVPQFPSQRLSREPILIVPLQPSSPGLLGYLDPREPHSINNLVVQFLGNEEVIATVRDDGDVEVVLVRHVVKAIERRAENGSTIGVVADEVRPIFQSNVGISAWGLAIHSQARILATSSNLHEVRVFKFGLMNKEDEDPPPTADEAEPPNSQQDQTRDMDGRPRSDKHRKLDVTQRVLNGDANIPYIAFCNTGDDPDARWLLTTDILGYCRIMDLHNIEESNVTAQQFRFGRTFVGHHGEFDRLNAGWAVMFLDRRSFQPERAFHFALGLTEGSELPGMKGNHRVWDLSDTVDRFPANSSAFVYHETQTRQERLEAQHREVESILTLSAMDSEVQDEHDFLHISEDATEQSEDGDYQVTMEGVQASTNGTNAFATHRNEADEGGDFNRRGGSDEDIVDVPSDLQPRQGGDMIDYLADDDPDDEGTEDTISYSALYGGKRIFGNQPYFYYQAPLCQGLPCPILHASVKNVYLLQPSVQQHYSGPFSPPMVGFANPLRQSIQHQFGYLNMFDRLNMNAYIPSLGAVVLASQKGRVLVLSLTKLPASTQYPPDMDYFQARKTNYTMRVAAILPFASQENENERPFAPLHGIAVGPMQGTEHLHDDKKRWRLMMMYQDHSVLSYDIRPSRKRDPAVDVGSVMV